MSNGKGHVRLTLLDAEFAAELVGMAKGKKKKKQLKQSEKIEGSNSSEREVKRKQSSPEAGQPPAKAQRIWREAIGAENGVLHSNGFHTYNVDPLDHAETDVRAYSHVTPLMKLLAGELEKSPEELGLWDPYFCKGGSQHCPVTLAPSVANSSVEQAKLRLRIG